MCQELETCDRPVCFFAHSAEELRRPEAAHAQPQPQPQLPGQGFSAGNLALQASGAGTSAAATGAAGSGPFAAPDSTLPAGITVQDAARFLASTSGTAATAAISAGTASSAGAAVDSNANPQVLTVLSQFRQRHAAAAAAAAVTTSALDNATAAASANAAAAVAGAPAGAAEAAYIDSDGVYHAQGAVQYVVASGLNAGAQLLHVSPAAAQVANPGPSAQWGSSSWASNMQLQPQHIALQQQQQQGWASAPLQQPLQQHTEREWASAPLPGVGVMVLQSPVAPVFAGAPAFHSASSAGVRMVVQPQVQQLQPQQQQQLMYSGDSSGVGSADMTTMPHQQLQQAQQQLLLQYQQQAALQPQAGQGPDMFLVPAQNPMLGAAGLQSYAAAPPSAGPQMLGSVSTASGRLMPVYSSMQAQGAQLMSGPVSGSRSAPLFTMSATGQGVVALGRGDAGVSTSGAAALSLETLQAMLHQMSMYEQGVQDL